MTYLFDEAINYALYNIQPVAISTEVDEKGKWKKKPPGDCNWTEHREKTYKPDTNNIYFQKYFSNRQDVKHLALIMKSARRLIAFDVDGVQGQKYFMDRLVARFPTSVREKVNKTTLTRTQGGGYHWLLEIPDGIDVKMITIWSNSKEGHCEVKLLGTEHYTIERGTGYESIKDISTLQKLTKEELDVILPYCRYLCYSPKMINTVLKYWKQPRRDGIVMFLSGYLKKYSKVPEDMANVFFESIVENSPFDDESLKHTLEVVHGSYEKEPKNLKTFEGLEEVFADDHEPDPDAANKIIEAVKEGFGKMGYQFQKFNFNKNKNDNSTVVDEEKESGIIKKATDAIMSQHTFATIKGSHEIYAYKDGVYVKGGEDLIFELCVKLFSFDLNINQRAEVREYIKGNTLHNMLEFDSDINIINMKNGLYDIERNVLHPHTPEYLSLKQIPVVYDKKALPKLFIKFLFEVVYREQIRTLIEAMSYTFWKDNFLEYIIILYGDGSNGKSVVFGILTALHGIDNVSNVSLKTILERPFGLYDLVGKNCNLDAELSTGIIEDTAILKKITGRQLVRVEQKNQRSFDARIHAKPWLSANNMPQAKDDTKAWRRRNIIIAFPVTFDVEEDKKNNIKKLDPQLIYKLTAQEELSGIFNILMHALRHVLKNQEIFQNERTIEQRRIKYEMLLDPVQGFLDEVAMVEGEAKENDFTVVDATYLAFKRFCEIHRIIVMEKGPFGKSMKKKGIIQGYAHEEGNKQKSIRIWKGIKLAAQYRTFAENELNCPGRQTLIDGIQT